MQMTMNFEEDTKRLNKLWENKVKCKCSHTFVLGRHERALCSYCGNWVYKTPKIEFKYKMLEQTKKEKK